MPAEYDDRVEAATNGDANRSSCVGPRPVPAGPQKRWCADFVRDIFFGLGNCISLVHRFCQAVERPTHFSRLLHCEGILERMIADRFFHTPFRPFLVGDYLLAFEWRPSWVFHYLI